MALGKELVCNSFVLRFEVSPLRTTLDIA